MSADRFITTEIQVVTLQVEVIVTRLDTQRLRDVEMSLLHAAHRITGYHGASVSSEVKK